MNTAVPGLDFSIQANSGQLVSRLEVESQSATTPSIEFSLHQPRTKSREPVEKFISGKFNQAYGAAIEEFFPFLLSRTDDGVLSSALGLRPGSDRPLFLEQYLDRPLEESLKQLVGDIISRQRIMEIGNLASSCKSSNPQMFIILNAVLARAGYDWVVFTATAQVRTLLKRLHFEPLTICAANANRLVNKSQRWGTYYNSHPQVQVGDLNEGLDILENNSFALKLLSRHEVEIESIASSLRNRIETGCSQDV